jgi:4-alpha-glucanotransferase
VAYTGTHDNDTARGWFESNIPREQEFAIRYLNLKPRNGASLAELFAWTLIRTVWSSVAVYALAPMQDFLNLGTAARMNFPSRLGGNWEWRMREEDMSQDLANRLRELKELYLR